MGLKLKGGKWDPFFLTNKQQKMAEKHPPKQGNNQNKKKAAPVVQPL
jgi:hypothetical protein